MDSFRGFLRQGEVTSEISVGVGVGVGVGIGEELSIMVCDVFGAEKPLTAAAESGSITSTFCSYRIPATISSTVTASTTATAISATATTAIAAKGRFRSTNEAVFGGEISVQKVFGMKIRHTGRNVHAQLHPNLPRKLLRAPLQVENPRKWRWDGMGKLSHF